MKATRSSPNSSPLINSSIKPSQLTIQKGWSFLGPTYGRLASPGVARVAGAEHQHVAIPRRSPCGSKLNPSKKSIRVSTTARFRLPSAVVERQVAAKPFVLLRRHSPLLQTDPPLIDRNRLLELQFSTSLTKNNDLNRKIIIDGNFDLWSKGRPAAEQQTSSSN